MTMPTRRRSGSSALQPGDIGWVALAAGVLLVGFAATVGVGLACAVFGAGWVWPHGVAGDARLLGRLLTGAPVSGLPPAARADAPSSAAIYTFAVITVLATVLAVVVVVRWLIDLLGEAGERAGGFATRGQARRVLSGGALPRRRVREIRPDLFDSVEPTGDTSREEP